MKRISIFFALLFGLLFLPRAAFAYRSDRVVVPLQSVTATGGLNDLDIRPYTRTGTFELVARNKAGTNPTLAVKLQQSGAPATGQNFTTTGTTNNIVDAGATTTVQLAAKFTQSGARSIKYVDLLIKKNGTITAGKKLTLNIDTDSSGVPSGTSIGTANTVDIDTEVATTYSWVRFTFPAAIDVANATAYHLVLSADYTASASNDVTWQSSTLASGGVLSMYNATTWTAVTTESPNFIISQLSFADITGGAYTSVTTAASFQTVNFELEGTVVGFVRAFATIGGTSSPEFFLSVLLNAEAR